MQTNFARRLVSLVSSLSILLQSFLPFTYINPSTIFAQDTLTNVISYNKDKGVFHFELNNKDIAVTTGQVSYTLLYKNETSGQIENVNGTTELSDTNFSRDIDAATCSTGGVCVRHEVKQGIMKISTANWFDSQWFKIENGSLVVKSQNTTGSISELSSDEQRWLSTGEIVVATPTASPIPTVEPSVQPTIEPTVAPTGQSPIATATPTTTPSLNDEVVKVEVVKLDGSYADPSLVPATWTDKADYAPTEKVVVSGKNFTSLTQYTIVISSTDEPAVTHTDTFTTLTDGTFTYEYQLDGNYRPNYAVAIKDGSGTVVASTTFTDASYTVGTFSDNSNTVSKTSFTRGETVYAKGTSTNSEHLRLLINSTSGSTVNSCNNSSSSTNVTCQYLLPTSAPFGTWQVKVQKCSFWLIACLGSWSDGNISSFSVVNTDSEAPSVPGTPITTSPTNDTTPTWTWTAATDNVGIDHYVFYWDTVIGGEAHNSGNLSTSTLSYTTSALTQGTWYGKVKAFDAAGNLAVSGNGAVLIDTTPPSLTQVTGVSSPTTDNTPNYVFHSSEAGTITYIGDCSSSTSIATVGNNTITFNTLSDGIHSNCRIRVTDAVGNISSTLTVSSFTVDTTPPDTILLSSGPTGTVTDTSATFLYYSSDLLGINFQCQLDGGGYSECNNWLVFFYKNYTGLSEGSHTFEVSALDSVGNVDPTPAIRTWIVDTVAPTITINNPITAPEQSKTITADGGDGILSQSVTTGSTCNASLTFTAYASMTFISETDNGKKVCYRSVDSVGNTSYLLSSAIAGIDRTAPTVPLNGLPNGTGVSTNDFYFTWGASSDASSVIYEYQASGSNAIDANGSLVGAWNSIHDGTSEQNHLTTPTIHSTGAPDGLYYWQVRAIDAAGNTSGWSTVWSMTIDTHAPVITITNPDTSPAHSKTVTATTNEGTLTMSVNEIGVTTCNSSLVFSSYSSMTFSSESDNGKSICYKAVDGVMNTTYSLSNAIGGIDWTAPSVPGLVSPINGYKTKGVAFNQTWNSVSGANLYEYQSCYADPGDLGEVCGSVKYSATQTGTTKLVTAGQPDSHFWWRVRARDVAGNWSAWGESREIYIDNTAPVISGIVDINVNTDAGSNMAVVSYSPTANDSVDGVVTVNCSPISGSSFSVGTTTVTCTAKDSVNNTSTKTFTVTVSDNENPTIAGTPFTATPTNNSKPKWAWATATDNVGVDHYIFYWDTVLGGESNNSGDISTLDFTHSVNLADGIWYGKVKAFDAAGNVSASGNGSVVIDTVNPTSVITSPDNDGTGTVVYSNSWDGSILGTAEDERSGMNGVKISIKNAAGNYFDGTTFVATASELLLDTTYVEGNWSYNGLTSPSEDSYLIKSHAIDNAGNMESTYTLTVILDKTIPEVAISLNPTVGDAANGWYKTQPEVTLTATDTYLDGVEYQ